MLRASCTITAGSATDVVAIARLKELWAEAEGTFFIARPFHRAVGTKRAYAPRSPSF